MPFVKPIPSLEQDLADKRESLGVSLSQQSVELFTICSPWLTSFHTMILVAMGVYWSVGPIVSLASFPWNDSTVRHKVVLLLIVLVFGVVPCIWLFILAVMTWSHPHQLIFDGRGGLILRSVARDQRIAIEDITTIVLELQQNCEESTDVLVIRTKLTDGKLKLPRFAEREEFLEALKAAHPAIAIETV